MNLKLVLEITGASAALIALGTAANAVRELRRIDRRKRAKLATIAGGKQMPSRKAG